MNGVGWPQRLMSTASTTVQTTPAPRLQDSRFDRRLSEIIDFATEVFAEKGYEGASMRDLSRLSGTSLAGLYYYLESKEKLLYLIQRHTFNTIIERLRERLASATDPEERIRIFVSNHVEYAIERQKAMKVLSHEDDVLKDSYGAELAGIKREYYRICLGLVEDLVRHEDLNTAQKAIHTRTAVMSLFGAMNWLYTWYNPNVDPNSEELSRQISDLFLGGIRTAAPVQSAVRSASQPVIRAKAEVAKARTRYVEKRQPVFKAK